MPIGHDERRLCAEEAMEDARDQRIANLKEMAKPVPYALDRANRMRRERLAEAVDFGMAHPLDIEMREALNAVDAAQMKVVNLIHDRVLAKRLLNDLLLNEEDER